MTREFSHESGYRDYVATAQNERAEALARAGFLVIAGADRALRRTVDVLITGAAGLFKSWQTHSDRRATYRALIKLDDRLLRDIGLTRADIEGSAGNLEELEAVIEEAAPVPASRPALVPYELKRAA